MELQFHKDPVRCLSKALQEGKSVELTQEIRLSDGMPDIGRVLGVWGQPVIRSKEWRSDSVGMSGGVMVWVLYAPEDGTEVRSMESWIPMQMSWDIPDGIPEGTVRFSSMIRFLDARSISARKMMLRVGICMICQALYPVEKSVSLPGEMPEDVQILRSCYPVRLRKEAGERAFSLDEDISMPEDSPKTEKILAYFMQPEITEKRIVGNRLLFKGQGNLRLLYRCPEGKLHHSDFELPFSQYADLQESYTADACADLYMAMTNLELDMPQDGQLRLKCSMIGQYGIDDLQMLQIPEDAYSTQRSVDLTMEDLELPVILDRRTELLAAEQNIPGLSGNMASLVFYPDQPRIRYTDQGIAAEQSALFQGIMSAEDGVLQSVNARWEGGMNLPADSSVKIDMTAQPKGFPESLPGLDGTAVTAQMQLHSTFSADQKFSMITDMKLGEVEDQMQDRPSLILCRPSGERLWDIAKRNGSTIGAIREANGIEGEPEPERMLLIPVS